MKVLITGANGYIGHSLYHALKDIYEVTPIGRANVNLLDSKSVDEFFDGKIFDIVLHCAIAGVKNSTKDWTTLDNNLIIYYNLLKHSDKFNRFISFGSGAELDPVLSKEPYGMSKSIIRNSVINKNNFYNLRIYAVFNENELDRRFIKSNIIRYIKKQPIEIYQNRMMDFFYMEDLIQLVKYYLTANNPPKEVDCCYPENETLLGIARIINTLSDYTVDINFKDKFILQLSYSGDATLAHELPIEWLGLRHGIFETYNKLKLCN